MPAPLGNKYALGNKGGPTPDTKTRKKIVRFKGLILNEMFRIFKSTDPKDIEYKRQIMLKAITCILPRALEVGNQDGEPFVIQNILNELEKDDRPAFEK